MAKPRITFALTRAADGSVDELRLYMNPEGRDLLVGEMTRLDEKWDHVHLQDEEWAIELPLRMAAHYPGDEELVSNAKILLRQDRWDEEYFPHVLTDSKQGD